MDTGGCFGDAGAETKTRGAPRPNRSDNPYEGGSALASS